MKKLNGSPRFYELLEQMRDTHNRKNGDYATKENPLQNLLSSEKYFNVPAYLGTAIRLSDKWERFTNLIKKNFKAEVKNESIIDTLMDMAVYSLLEIILIEKELKK